MLQRWSGHRMCRPDLRVVVLTDVEGGERVDVLGGVVGGELVVVDKLEVSM